MVLEKELQEKDAQLSEKDGLGKLSVKGSIIHDIVSKRYF